MKQKLDHFEDVRDTIVADMKLVSAEVLANDIATRLESLLFKGESIQEVANELSSVTTVNKSMNRASEDDDFMRCRPASSVKNDPKTECPELEL